MKMHFLLSALVLLLVVACNNTNNNSSNTQERREPVAMKDIDLSVSGITFTKAINDAEKHYQSSDSLLTIDGISATNYFIAPDGGRTEATAPILLTEIDNCKPFTFTTRVESSIEKIYDAGAAYIFVDNSRWLKFAFERDEKLRCRVVTVRTEGSSDDNNHDIISQDHVYMRVSSNTKQIGFYYSSNGADWNLARIFRNEYPAKIWLGISSQSPKEGNNIARFSHMSLTESYISNHRLGE